MTKFVFLFATALLIDATIATHFCRSDICPANSRHIGCGNNGDWGSQCSAYRSIVPMTRKLRILLLKKHNIARNNIAMGKVPGYLSANRMPKMSWDMELQRIAEFNVKTCVYGHNECSNTEQFRYVGQNIAMRTGDHRCVQEPNKIINKFFDRWFTEYKNCSMSYINNFHLVEDKDIVIGHFTQIAAMRSKKLGCAISKFQSSTDNQMNFYLVCNYSFGNVISDSIYTAGPTGSRCKSGRNRMYKGLCNSREDIQPIPRSV